MAAKQKRTLVCGQHGTTEATFVCQHIAGGVGCGFHCLSAKTTARPDAWCDACEVELNRAGKWNHQSEAFADIKMLCTECYDVAKQRNSQADIRYLSAPASPAALEKLFHRWVHEAQDRNDAHDAEFGLSKGRWDYDAARGTITFSNNGTVHAIADVQLVGSFSTNTNTWLWAWANNHQPHLVRDIGLLRMFGVVRGLPKWTNDQAFPADEFDSWQFTAAAAALLNAPAVYRWRSEHCRFFSVLHNLRRPE